MKLATLRTAAPDGQLLVVSHDLSRMASAAHLAPTLQAALDTWESVAPALAALSSRLNASDLADAQPYDPARLAAPLPRAWQFLDASAFPSHGELMQRAFNMPPIETTKPLMYQGLSHHFQAATDPAPFPAEADGIDFEAEIAVITGPIPLGAAPAQALAQVRLIGLLNDWSLRVLAPIEMKTGFGWIQAKPASAMAPVVVTPDELGAAWAGGKLAAVLHVQRNEAPFGAVPATHMHPGFAELLAHAAATRNLCAGTILGSGTVSVPHARQTGSCCIAERRALDMIDTGAPQTAFLRFNERVRIRAVLNDGTVPFGELDQRVIQAHAANA